MMRVRRATRVAAAGIALAILAALLPPPAAVADEIVSAIARGGRLYDDWRTELDLHTRRISHLPAPDITGAAAEGEGLCVACHGWDYHGVPWAEGGSIADRAGTDPADVVAILTDATHGYGTYMDETDLRDLALFVTRGQIDMTRWISISSGRAKGEAEAGSVYFQSICAGCHGADGMAVEEMPPLGPFSRDEPWHAMHIMMNGHPNGSMPPLRVLDASHLADALAYMQALPSRPVIAAVVRGGRLYDTWSVEAGRSVPEGWHPLWPEDRRTEAEAAGGAALARAQARSWRCVSCHGWDYRGRDGMAMGGTPPPFVGIDGKAGADPAALAALLTDDAHGYGRLLSRRDIMDLATFVSVGQVDMAPWIHPDTGHFLADGAAFEGHYQTICATCHGPDGQAIRTMPPVGRAVAGEPQRALHSVFNGHPGEAMPPLRAMGIETAAGILSFAETLPPRKH
ncbi:c-type cytochrome [Roseospira marina]|nr:c-type cytochrome [Roseospira marina]MBB4314322.1 mono/diheme cytochrome c family protein [Roseospira marina]MBB5087482.1 mono/diheme cytochrome c family protein [Roseospira marina]